MDHAGVFQPSSFMAPDALAGAIQALALVLALVSSFRLLLRIAHTTNLVVHRLTMLAMLGLTRAMPSWLEWAFLMTSLLIGSIALRRGFRSHRQPTPLRLFGMGIGTLLLARVTDATSPWEIIVVVLGATFLIAAHALNWRHGRSCPQCASTPVDVRPASCGVR